MALSNLADLRRKILFTLMVLAVYRVGVQVPTPGINREAMMAFFSNLNSGVFGLFNTFSGGALAQFSIFALGIMPYISASIIFQLLSTSLPSLMALKKEGQYGQKRINQYTRYTTILLAVIQGSGISNWLMSQTSPDGLPLVTSSMIGFIPFQVLTVATLTAGTCLIMWLGEQITERGIGNGSSLIIFTGIAASILPGAQKVVALVSHNELSMKMVLLLVLGAVAIIAFVAYMEVSFRKVPIQYSVRTGNVAKAPSSHLPLKVNFSGVIPPIFANSLLLFPATMSQFINVPALRGIQEAMLNPNGLLFNLLFVSLIVFFSFFYSEMVFNADEVSDNLKKYGGFVPGVRSGRPTAEYFKRVLDRITVLGALYLSFICVLPHLFAAQVGLPISFGGTSLLILVGVAIDTGQQIQSHLISSKYENFVKPVKARRRVDF